MNPGTTRPRILVAEDEYFIVEEFIRSLTASGAEIVGPAPTVAAAAALANAPGRLDGAVLDINLRGQMVYDVADMLLERRVPVVFTTGYDGTTIPSRYDLVPRFEKPVDPQRVFRSLLGRS